MKRDQYHKILDEITVWEIGTTSLLVDNPKPDRTNEKHYPIQGYEVIHKFKEFPVTCEWCGAVTTNSIKTYRRDSEGCIWNGKCSTDKCKTKKSMTAVELAEDIKNSGL